MPGDNIKQLAAVVLDAAAECSNISEVKEYVRELLPPCHKETGSKSLIEMLAKHEGTASSYALLTAIILLCLELTPSVAVNRVTLECGLSTCEVETNAVSTWDCQGPSWGDEEVVDLYADARGVVDTTYKDFGLPQTFFLALNMPDE